ncbi:MAG: twin-arginine translocase subunit TatC [Candidatus Nitrosopolaris sp.]
MTSTLFVFLSSLITMGGVYKYGESMGVNTFFNISEFIPFIMQFLLVFGFSYQLPIIMCAITQFKIVGIQYTHRILHLSVLTLWHF